MLIHEDIEFDNSTDEPTIHVDSDVIFESPPECDQPLCEIVPKSCDGGYFALRPYQTDSVDAVYDDWQSHQSTILVQATGLGKTVCIAEVAMRWPDHLGRVLVIAHREELIDQAAEKIGVHLDEQTGIEMGDRREHNTSIYNKRAKVLVASVQTLVREKRRSKFNPMDIGCLIIDECHHAPARSYRTVLEYFLKNPQLRILGVTATPQRADEKALGDIFQSVSYELGIVEGIKLGWLVDIESKQVVIDGLDFSKCRTTAGDLNDKDVASAFMGGVDRTINVSAELMTELEREEIEKQERMLHAVAVPTIKESQGRPTIVFCATKAHAERMTEIFNRYPGINSEFVTDDTSKEDRTRIIKKFRAGNLQILTGVGIFCEGFDARVDVVVIARKTKSKSLLTQMIGRGTRPLPNTVDNYCTAEERREAIANSAKPCMTVLDFIGTTGRHDLAEVVDVLGGEYDEDVIEAAKAKLREGDSEIVSELLKKTKEELEAERDRFEKEKKRLQMEREEREKLAKERADREREERRIEAEKRAKIRADVQYRTEEVNLKGAVIPEQIGVGCFRGGATDGQIKFAMRLGVSHEAACKMTRCQAGAVIDKLQAATGREFRVRFGKYMGCKLGDLPSHYINWVWANINEPTILQNISLMKQQAVAGNP